jgi:uncharacterized protein YjeT (DUF2065 family)
MNNATLVSTVLGPLYLVMGLSLLFYADVWHKMIKEWEKNHFVLIMGGYLALITGLIIVNLWNVWEWNVWLIVTVSGWGAVFKGVFYFLAPGDWIKEWMKKFNTVNQLYFWSLVMVVAGAALSYYAYLI